MNQKITTAVFPVGGLGTRFLPATKASPKEMLPIVNKPLIQYVVEEAIEAGITQIVFVTSQTKRAIEDYFDSNYELESRLESAGKLKMLSSIRNIAPPGVSFTYVRQSAPLGLGDAVLRAKHVVGSDHFAVLLADDIIDSGDNNSCLRSMMDVYEQTGSSVLAVEAVSPEDVSKYGIVSLDNSGSYPNKISGIVEKPKLEDAPSNMAVTGRYILSAEIFDHLESTKVGSGGEIQLTDAISALMKESDVYAHLFSGDRYDCGSHIGMVKATLNYALKNNEMRAELQKFIADKVDEDSD
jgi:UTP--glucose-1-phosphate uridylyltransferase